MEIKILKSLEKNLVGPFGPSIGLSIEEIDRIKYTCRGFKTINDTFGKLDFDIPIPKVLLEFFYLAGEKCGYFHSGVTLSKMANKGYSLFKQIDQRIPQMPNDGNGNYELSLLEGEAQYGYWPFGFQTLINEFLFINLYEENDDPKVYFADISIQSTAQGSVSVYQHYTGYSLKEFIEKHVSFFQQYKKPWEYKIATLKK